MTESPLRLLMLFTYFFYQLSLWLSWNKGKIVRYNVTRKDIPSPPVCLFVVNVQMRIKEWHPFRWVMFQTLPLWVLVSLRLWDFTFYNHDCDIDVHAITKDIQTANQETWSKIVTVILSPWSNHALSPTSRNNFYFFSSPQPWVYNLPYPWNSEFLFVLFY